MATPAVVDLIELIRQSRLLDPQQVEEVAALQDRFGDPRELARHLIKKTWLTPYQINQLFQGKGHELILGQYTLLERLGEGGMGQVFKARHQRLDRVVALKVIRKEKLDNPVAVRRFQREIRSAAKLSHPNIVMAFDADQAGQTHFFAMEYVEGVDLNRLVTENGPLPVSDACEFIRQAALGLQHAFENGLIHRDIKPANLFVEGGKVKTESPKETTDTVPIAVSTPRPQRIKILDMGLARTGAGETSGDNVSRLTQEGTVMGTPDFIAPEQAMDSDKADIRADLYSLGCTFYFILTGRVPFAGGTLMEKIIRHRGDPAEPVTHYRPDVPPKVAAIIQRLMAKKPEERYSKPAELVQALEAAVKAGVPSGPPTLLTPSERQAVSERSQRRQPVWPYLAAGAAAIGFLGLLLFAYIIIAVTSRKNAKKLTPNNNGTTATANFLDKLDLVKKPGAGVPADTVAILQSGAARPRCHAFSPNGKFLAAGYEDGSIRVWSLETLEAQLLTPKHAGQVSALAIAPDSGLLATVSYDHSLHLWDLKQPKIPMLANREVDRLGVNAVAFNRDGTELAAAGEDYTVHLWKLKGETLTDPVQLSKNGGPIYALAFDASGKYLASAGRDKFVRIWDAAGRRLDPLAGWNDRHREEILAIAYSGKNSLLAIAGRDKTIQLWEMSGLNRRDMKVVVKHDDWFNAVAFSPDGSLLAAASQDGRLFLWDIEAKKTRTWELAPPLTGVSFAADGRHVAVSDGAGRLLILRLAAIP